MARDINGKTIKVATGTREVNPDAKADRWKGAVTFPNGSVYFPNGDFFILPNGYRIQNGPNAKAQIDEYLKKPASSGGQIQYPPGEDPNRFPRSGTDLPGITGGGSNPKGQPGGGAPPPGSDIPPPPTGVNGPMATPPWLMTDGPQGPGTGGNFAKGQPRFGQDPGGAFSPRSQPFYGDQGWYPWIDSFPQGTGSGNNPYANARWGDPGMTIGGGGFSQGGNPMYYDPLGIGQMGQGQNFYGNYMDDNADFYPLVGANSVTGYSPTQPRWGMTGGQGGYGIGMVGPEYSGPLWNQYPDINLLLQRMMLTNPTTAQQSPDALPAPQTTTANTNSNATNNNSNGSSNVNSSPKGQPAAQQQAAAQQPTQSGGPSIPGSQNFQWNPAWGTPTDEFGNEISADQYKQRMADPMNYYVPSSFDTKYGNLVPSSVGNQNVYKQNGSDGSSLYHFDPKTMQWKHMTQQEYIGYNNPADFYANPHQYAQQAGAQKNQTQKQGAFWATKPGTGTYR